MTCRSFAILIGVLAFCGSAAAGDRVVRYKDSSGRTHVGRLTVPAGPTGPIPLVVVPERGAVGTWGNLPQRGSFALLRLVGGPARVGPDGIDALAEAPAAVRRAVPGLRLAPGRVYVLGRAEGARRGLRLAVRRPKLLAGVAALDTFQGDGFLPSGRQLAFSQVPIQLWTGVPEGRARAQRLVEAIRAARAGGRVLAGRGAWPARLETALVSFGLLPLPAALVRPAGRRRAARPACAPSALLSYPWPVRPFRSPHAVRGNVGDPRTQFALASPDDEDPAGRFAFHNGADVVAPGGTPVYPVVSGIAERSGRFGVVVRAPGGRSFDYQHIEPSIGAGRPAIAGVTIIGRVLPRAGHVHLTEFAPDGTTANPLLHLTPYADPTAPVVSSAELPASARGRVEGSATAYDVPALPAGGAWTGLPVAPARVTLSLRTRAGQEVRSADAVDFTRGLPANDAFRSTYGSGTRQNFAVVGFHYFAGTAGSYRYLLSLDVRSVAPGRYTLVVIATDTCGNAGTLSRPIRVLRDPSWRPPAAPAPVTAPVPSRRPKPAVLRWRGRGYTVVLASVPERAGKNAARAVAVRARATGIDQVGVLRSSRYRSLTPGYRVVFSGVYRSSAAALAATRRISRRFPEAYPRLIGAKRPFAESVLRPESRGAAQERGGPPRTLRG